MSSRESDLSAGERNPPVSVGQVLRSKYRVEALLGQGGMGWVFLASQLPLERPVAIKLLKGSADALKDRFFREASLCARLQHPNIVTVHDYGEIESGELMLVMEYLDGPTLSAVNRQAPLEEARICRIIAQICRALRAAHSEGIVHRDLKLDNIVLLQDEEGLDLIKVVDFGLAKVFGPEAGAANPSLTVAGGVVGTPTFMAPEQIMGGAPDQRTDIYALGIILYTLLEGRAPFRGKSILEVLEQHIHTPVPPLSSTPSVLRPRLEALIQRCTEKQPGDRYQSVEALVNELKAVYALSEEGTGLGLSSFSGQSSAPREYQRLPPEPADITGALDPTLASPVPKDASPMLSPPQREQNGVWALAAVVLLAVLALGFWGMQAWRSSEASSAQLPPPVTVVLPKTTKVDAGEPAKVDEPAPPVTAEVVKEPEAPQEPKVEPRKRKVPRKKPRRRPRVTAKSTPKPTPKPTSEPEPKPTRTAEPTDEPPPLKPAALPDLGVPKTRLRQTPDAGIAPEPPRSPPPAKPKVLPPKSIPKKPPKERSDEPFDSF